MKTILVIDDNNDLRENTAEILELAGYKTFKAENGKAGVEIAAREKPSLIVCDIMMPELDGYGVLHLIKKNPSTENIPFIFLTAKTERSDLRKGMEMGADDYITKPFDDIELLNAIEVRLKKAQLLEKNYENTSSGLQDFFSDLNGDSFSKKLTETYNIEQFFKKQIIYAEGKKPRFLYLLMQGKAKAIRSHEDGKEYIIELFDKGDMLGYSSVIENKSYDHTAVVVEEAEMMMIPADEFLKMIDTDISIASKFIRIITQNIKEKEERMLNLAYSSLRKRIARALLEIHEKYSRNTSNPLSEFSREEIAQYVGTATESLIRTLGDFKSEKLIDIKAGKISIVDEKKLRNLVF